MSKQPAKMSFMSPQECKSRYRVFQEINHLEQEQKVNHVIDSLVHSGHMYFMSVIFSFDPSAVGSTPDEMSDFIEHSPEITTFLDTIEANRIESPCMFIPFRALSTFLDQFPLSVIMFAKHQIRPYEFRCVHLLYKENGKHHTDTSTSFIEAFARIRDITVPMFYRVCCQFRQDENQQMTVRVRRIIESPETEEELEDL